MISGHLSIKYGLKGPNLVCGDGVCTTSTHANRSGDADDSVRRCRPWSLPAAGVEMRLRRLPALGGFAQAKALSGRNDAAEGGESSVGTVIAMVLCWVMAAEPLSWRGSSMRARRGANIYAELIGFSG